MFLAADIEAVWKTDLVAAVHGYDTETIWERGHSTCSLHS